jgi:hypothetical protein
MALAPSKKHVVGRNLGRLEPNVSGEWIDGAFIICFFKKQIISDYVFSLAVLGDVRYHY